jgi:hypothetical protein
MLPARYVRGLLALSSHFLHISDYFSINYSDSSHHESSELSQNNPLLYRGQDRFYDGRLEQAGFLPFGYYHLSEKRRWSQLTAHGHKNDIRTLSMIKR